MAAVVVVVTEVVVVTAVAVAAEVMEVEEAVAMEVSNLYTEAIMNVNISYTNHNSLLEWQCHVIF